jgi:xylulokinase
MPEASPLLVGVDVGTTTIKALAFAADGSLVAQAATPTPTHHPQPGWAFQRPAELWDAVVAVLAVLTRKLDDPQAVAGLAVASVGEAGVPLDAAGQPTHDIIAWFDTRTAPQARRLDQIVDQRRLFAVTGLALQPIFTLCKLLWLQEHAPAATARTVRWLNTADYIAFRLCGVQATDYSLASRTLALDLRGRRWADDLIAAAGLAPSLFAPLVASGTALGRLLPEVAAATGLPLHARVAAGGHDHVCAALALGVTAPGSALNSMGTAEAIFLPVDAPVADPRMGEQGYAQGIHVDARRNYVMGGLFTSGAAGEWFRTTCAAGADFATLIAEAEQILPAGTGVCFLPHLRLANAPNIDPLARGAFIGLDTQTTRGILFRAVLEGLACELRYALAPLLGYAQTPLQTLLGTGGGTRNPLYLQIKAAVLNQTIQVSAMTETTTHGAALLAGIGAGVYADVDAALAAVQHPCTPVIPDPAWVAAYASLYTEVYQHMYTALRPLHHALAALREHAPQVQGEIAATPAQDVSRNG